LELKFQELFEKWMKVNFPRGKSNGSGCGKNYLIKSNILYGRLSGHGSSTGGRGERSLESSRFWLICGLLPEHKSGRVPREHAPLVAGRDYISHPRRGGRESQ